MANQKVWFIKGITRDNQSADAWGQYQPVFPRPRVGDYSANF